MKWRAHKIGQVQHVPNLYGGVRGTSADYPQWRLTTSVSGRDAKSQLNDKRRLGARVHLRPFADFRRVRLWNQRL